METKPAVVNADEHKLTRQDIYDQNEPDFEEEDDIKTILAWHAPGRPYRKRSFEFYLNSFLLVMAVEIILFLFSQYLLMLVVVSLAFLAFALAIVPPHQSHYKISTEGVLIEDHFFIWEELYDFYFLKHHGHTTLHIRTKSFFPGEVTVMLGDVPAKQARSALLPYLPFREYVKPTFTEKAGNWLEQNFPLEKSQQHPS